MQVMFRPEGVQPPLRCGYSVSKRLVKLTRFQRFPLQVSGHQDLPALPWLNNENFKEKVRKKFLIFVMFTLVWIFYKYNRCFVLLLDSSTCLGPVTRLINMPWPCWWTHQHALASRFKNRTWTAKRARLFEK